MQAYVEELTSRHETAPEANRALKIATI